MTPASNLMHPRFHRDSRRYRVGSPPHGHPYYSKRWTICSPLLQYTSSLTAQNWAARLFLGGQIWSWRGTKSHSSFGFTDFRSKMSNSQPVQNVRVHDLYVLFFEKVQFWTERNFAPSNSLWTFLSVTFKADDQQGDCKFAAPLPSYFPSTQVATLKNFWIENLSSACWGKSDSPNLGSPQDREIFPSPIFSTICGGILAP